MLNYRSQNIIIPIKKAKLGYFPNAKLLCITELHQIFAQLKAVLNLCCLFALIQPNGKQKNTNVFPKE
jgi:hypothetical protein